METSKVNLKKKLLYALTTGMIYVLLYFVSRNYFDIGQQYYMYTPSWTARNVFWLAALISVIPSVFGYYRFSIITLAGYILGVIAGEVFGGFHSDIPPVYPHYGWIIWGAVYFTSAMFGMLVEKKAANDVPPAKNTERILSKAAELREEAEACETVKA